MSNLEVEDKASTAGGLEQPEAAEQHEAISAESPPAAALAEESSIQDETPAVDKPKAGATPRKAASAAASPGMLFAPDILDPWAKLIARMMMDSQARHGWDTPHSLKARGPDCWSRGFGYSKNCNYCR